MVTTGKKRLTIEYETEHEQMIRQFKLICTMKGQSLKDAVIRLIKKDILSFQNKE